jgi:SWI/SNF-related matrix-associated actin-dependent regulator of chromatin subfamily A protein 2/4
MLNSSTTDPQSSARVALVRRTPLDDDSPPQEKKSHKGKKSKKEGKETIKEKKIKEKKIKEKKSIKSINSAKSDANKCSIKEQEQFLGKDDLDDGILHPVDLVIQRKKRKGRDQKGVVRAVSLQGVSNSGVPKSSGAAAAVGATMSANSRKFLQAAPGWGAQFAASPSIGQASGSQQQQQQQQHHQQDGKGGVVTVLKKLRTDGGKRRPSRT